MLRNHARVLCALALLAWACDDEPVAPPGTFDPYGALADPALPTRRLPGELRLVSSRERDALGELRNRDYNHFVGRDGGEVVIFDERGPGVVVRMWFTIQDATHMHEAGDTLRLHLYLDGEEVPLVDDEDGATLADLTGAADDPDFQPPWTAGRAEASNAYLVWLPMGFQRDARITLEDGGREDLIVYYQVDWRSLPRGTAVTTFNGRLDEAQRANLDAGERLWFAHQRPGIEDTIEATVAPGETVELAVTGPTLVHALTLEGDGAGEDRELTSELVVDGYAFPATSFAQLVGAGPPAAPYQATFAATEANRAVLRYPQRVDAELTWRVTHQSAAPRALRLSVLHDAAAHEPGLRRLRAHCGSETTTDSDGFVSLAAFSGSGHFAGQSLTIRGHQYGWTFMEGDHVFTVDGDPRVLGTGIEDYIGGSFYFIGGAFGLPLAGAPGFDYCCGHLDSDEVHVSMYRHHLLDTVGFERSFDFSYEVYAGATFEHCTFAYID